VEICDRVTEDIGVVNNYRSQFDHSTILFRHRSDDAGKTIVEKRPFVVPERTQ